MKSNLKKLRVKSASVAGLSARRWVSVQSILQSVSAVFRILNNITAITINRCDKTHRFMFMEDKMPVIALIIGVLLAATDQIIKYFVLTYLQPVGSVTAIDGLLDFTYVENRGVAFGMFSDMRWFFVAVTVVLIAIIIYIMFKKKPSGKMFYISAALIIGGGIGNLIDRIFTVL